MRFFVENEVFEKLDNVCFGVVVARGIDNVTNKSEIKDMLESNISSICEQIANQNVKEHPRIVPYRDAFIKLGFNPNKFAPSVEALITRIAKKGQLPAINNVVDLANAVSIKHILPIGAHDIDLLKDQITVRLSVAGDSFSPFGVSEPEALEPGEVVVALRSAPVNVFRHLSAAARGVHGHDGQISLVEALGQLRGTSAREMLTDRFSERPAELGIRAEKVSACCSDCLRRERLGMASSYPDQAPKKDECSSHA